MKPDEPSDSQRGEPLLPQRSMVGAPKQRPFITPQEAAAKVIRTQIDSLYTQNNSVQPEVISPYKRTQDRHTAPQSDQWKRYHTAWQDYYQKYYEGYYTHHLKIAQQQGVIDTHAKDLHPTENKSYFSNQPMNKPGSIDAISTEEAVFDLRQKLLGKVQESTRQIKKSRHFIPIISGIIVVLIFLFLQYNRVLISNVVAYVSPGNIDPQNIIIDPNTDTKVGPTPRLIIPKINVDVPVWYNIGSDYSSQMTAMAKGVAQFAIPGASSHPGQIGNTVIAGHSSNDLFDSGDYKFIFAQLDKLNIGDIIYANYESTRYTYTVINKEIVKPSEINKLVYQTTKPILTLLTCTPLGTSLNRLLVIAQQISPDPSQSIIAPINSGSSDTTSKTIPGNSPTFFERLFGANSN